MSPDQATALQHGRQSETLSQKKKKELASKKKTSKILLYSQPQWFMPVITELWELKAGGSLEVRNLRLAWATQQEPLSTKNFLKLACAT